MKNNFNQLAVQAGFIISYAGSTVPAGWVPCDGKTIGNAASGATRRANADCITLFMKLWNSLPDSIAPVSGGRGVDALSDFNANKTIKLPDLRGRVCVGRGNMGGTAANRITSLATSNLGTVGGAYTVTLTTANLPAHSHTFTFGSGDNLNHNHAIPSETAGSEPESGGSVWPQRNDQGFQENRTTNTATITHSHTVTLSDYGSGGAHVNTQPTLYMNKLIKL